MKLSKFLNEVEEKWFSKELGDRVLLNKIPNSFVESDAKRDDDIFVRDPLQKNFPKDFQTYEGSWLVRYLNKSTGEIKEKRGDTLKGVVKQWVNHFKYYKRIGDYKDLKY